jgi:hypothetical protein
MGEPSRTSASAVHPEDIADSRSPDLRAWHLLCEILPQDALEEFLTKGFFHHRGKVGVYRISHANRTEIYRNGRLSACACLQLSIPAPGYDRMIAEYLILNSDENLYWTKANVFPVESRLLHPCTIAMLIVDAALLLNLVISHFL